MKRERKPLRKGQKFGKLTVLHRVDNRYPIKYRVKYECGTETEVFKNNLCVGKTKSCGCNMYKKTHGMAKNKFYLKAFLLLKKPELLCREWKDITSIIKDLEKLPKIKGKHQINRIDINKPWGPDNIQYVKNRSYIGHTVPNRTSKTGYIGVIKQGKAYCAYITEYGTKIHLGSFKTPEEAVERRNKYLIDTKSKTRLIQEIK